MKRRNAVVAVVLIALLALVALYLRRSLEPRTAGTLVVGAIYPLSGPASSLGVEFKGGLELAVQEARETKGINVVLHLEDGKGEPKTSIAAYQKLQSHGVAAVFTTISGVALALKPLAMQSGTLLFADAAHPAITEGGKPYIFRHNQTATQEADAILAHLVAAETARRVAIFVSNDEYSAAVVRNLVTPTTRHPTAAHLEFSVEQFDPSSFDMRAGLRKLLSADPDAIILSGAGRPLGVAIAEARQLGYSGRIYSTMGFSVTPDAQTAAGESAIGIWHTRIAIDTGSRGFLQFAKKYAERFGREPRDYAVLAFNSASLFFEAFSRASDRQSGAGVSESIHRLGSFVGAGEQMTISDSGDILPEIEIVQHQR